jgi:hypothetical protein
MNAAQPSTPNGGRLGFDDPVVKQLQQLQQQLQQLQNLLFSTYVARQFEFEPDR